MYDSKSEKLIKLQESAKKRNGAIPKERQLKVINFYRNQKYVL